MAGSPSQKVLTSRKLDRHSNRTFQAKSLKNLHKFLKSHSLETAWGVAKILLPFLPRGPFSNDSQ